MSTKHASAEIITKLEGDAKAETLFKKLQNSGKISNSSESPTTLHRQNSIIFDDNDDWEFMPSTRATTNTSTKSHTVTYRPTNNNNDRLGNARPDSSFMNIIGNSATSNHNHQQGGYSFFGSERPPRPTLSEGTSTDDGDDHFIVRWLKAIKLEQYAKVRKQLQLRLQSQ